MNSWFTFDNYQCNNIVRCHVYKNFFCIKIPFYYSFGINI